MASKKTTEPVEASIEVAPIVPLPPMVEVRSAKGPKTPYVIPRHLLDAHPERYKTVSD